MQPGVIAPSSMRGGAVMMRQLGCEPLWTLRAAVVELGGAGDATSWEAPWTRWELLETS